ncbi:hypothetical protein F4782DRAFT_499514 [Xylaria castorea]|nr:hypothetical protein F4782DRAFT_499514 [Xylaria castorea]
MPAVLGNFIMTTPHTTSRRGSTATEMTLTDYTGKRESFDDDEKTLSGFTMNDNSSSHSKKKFSKAVTHLKSKLKAKDGKTKQKTSIPPNYYPDSLRTFEALAASRI